MSVIELLREVERLKTSGRADLGVALYRDWLERNPSPLAYAVWFNLGVELASLKRAEEAIAAYRQALEIKADFIQARFNLGTQLEQLGSRQEALAEWRGILADHQAALVADQPMWVLTLNNLGRLLEIERQYPEAEAVLTQSLALDPQQPKALQHWLHLRQKQCAWPVCAELGGISTGYMIDSASGLSTLALTDDPAQQLAAAQRFVADRVQSFAPLSDHAGYGHRRLRIGYLSSDFCLHPVALLTAELFELHDRERFAVHGFCWTRDDGSALRRRIIASMDQFTQIADLDDEAAARCIRAQEIDLLIDLQGLTSGARPNILARRPAPVQIAYLGFPGTSGQPAIEYVIADDYVLPPDEAVHYSETPLRLPHCFQVSDRRREQTAPLTRAEYRIPDAAFVFCCFNNNYKITPDVFGVWMRILQRVPDSLLWLLADNPWVHTNLSQAAERQGIDSRRLRFADRVAPPLYLARYGLADLFLDTFPFNAGTTANDALWMGLPLLTLSGRAFASRMAGSLLQAVNLPELIAADLREYEEKAVSLAQDRRQIVALKRALAEQRQQDRLFDMPTRVRDLEALYHQAYTATSASDRPLIPASDEGQRFLHVGCGRNRKQNTLPIFNNGDWHEIRYDIDPAAQPDIVGSMTDMGAVMDASVDAIYTSHTIEHLYAHEVAFALKEFLRVLKHDGVAVIICPDLQSVCALVAANQLTEPAYHSPAGPIAPLDILFGHQAAIASGNTFMAHRGGFTRDTLAAALAAAGFGSVAVLCRPEQFDLWAFASKRELEGEAFAALSRSIFASV